MTDDKRRRLVQAGLVAPLLGWSGARAQVPGRNLAPGERKPGGRVAGSLSLLRAPRHALVIGNSRYRFGALRNPANDARAIGEELRRTGFEVVTRLDLPRQEMLEAIRAYGESVAKAKAVGVFYFAGHGVQLAWRNYLVPSDAAIATIDDIQGRCVDVNAVIEGITRAANPMNVVILDACRENPFSREMKIEQRGLSQLDAPPTTLLAYATSPGNVASDGEGANGLYTELLLREMQVPETKIEDVFKRVRLEVRRRSNGQQIPWESTSLEEDFWFIPPKDLKAQSEREAEREYRVELALWEKIKDSTASAPLADYLRRYPSGRFAEIAQAQLDRILAREGENKIEIVVSPQNPYATTIAVANTNYKVGDTYTYNQMDAISKVVQQQVADTVTSLTASEVIYDDGKLVTDLLGNPTLQRDGRTYSPRQLFPAEFVLGKRWSTLYEAINPTRGSFIYRLDFRITRRERISVPAGTFDTFRIDGEGPYHGKGLVGQVQMTHWFAPEKLRRPVATQNISTFAGSMISRADREELVSFRQG